MAAEAIRDYVELNSWQIEEIQKALGEANRGEFQTDTVLPGTNGVNADTAGALYNYLLLARGSAGGVHNPVYVRELIYEGKIFGTVDQDPYPQAYNAMRMAWLHFNGKDAEIPKPFFLPLPLVTKENAEKTPAAWGC